MADNHPVQNSHSAADLVPNVGELSLIEAQLWQMARDNKSPAQMELATNIPAAQCWAIVTNVAESKKVYSPALQRTLLMDDLYEMKEELREYRSAISAGMGYKAYIEAIRVLDDIMTKRDKYALEEAQTITKTYSVYLLRLVQEAFKKVTEYLEENYPEVPRNVVVELVYDALTDASSMATASAEHMKDK